jgi:hypothetical protein
MGSKQELIEPHRGDKRYVRRDDKDHFEKPGQGDRGDVKR